MRDEAIVTAKRTTSADVSTTASTLTLSGAMAVVTVINRGTTGVVWVRTDGTAAVAKADENYPVLPGLPAKVQVSTRTWDQGQGTTQPDTTVSAITETGTNGVTIIGV